MAQRSELSCRLPHRACHAMQALEAYETSGRATAMKIEENFFSSLEVKKFHGAAQKSRFEIRFGQKSVRKL